MSRPILVWGAGAIGACLGAAFVRAGETVVFVDVDADHVDAMNARGLAITGPIDPHHVAARAVAPADLTGTFDRVILAVKSHQTAAALDDLVPHLPEDGVIVSAQNGLEERRIAHRVGAARTLGCFVNFGADYIEPGTVLFGGRGAVVLGEVDGAMTSRLAAMRTLFATFEPRAIETANIFGFLWAKLVYGSMLFATAVTNDSIADVLAMERHRPMLTRLAHEVQAVAMAEGIRMEAFDGFDPAAFAIDAVPGLTARSFDEMVAHNRKSAKSHSGIWRDLAVRKRRTEVDAQLGPIVDLGRVHAIATPIVEAVTARIHAIEDGTCSLDIAWLDAIGAVDPEGSAS